MRARHLIGGVAIAILLGGGLLIPSAPAQQGIYIPLLTYRTGPFASTGTPLANGMADYFTMLNERDGGIGGVGLIVEECETGFDTKKGVECYEAAKGKNPVVIHPSTTGIALQLIPKAAADKIPVLTMGYGLSASGDGNVFPWTFGLPANYADGVSMFIRYVAGKEGGLDKLKGKTIGVVYHETSFGKEPIPLFTSLAAEYGFALKLYPVPVADIQNQASIWQGIRGNRPDWIYLQGFGPMNPNAVKEAVKIGYPMDRLIGNWWAGNDEEARRAGDDAKGYLSLDFNLAGATLPVMRDIIRHSIDSGKSQTAKEKVGENLYNRGVLNAMIIAEAIRTAQQITGRKVVTGMDVRRGLEALNITAARLKEMGADGFAAPIRTSCEDHNGHQAAYMAAWDGGKWVKASDWISPLKEKVRPLITAAARTYAAATSDWPKRTEPCDNHS